MSVGVLFLETVYRAMNAQSVFHDTPLTPWRDRATRACLDRECTAHTSCMRREAWCVFEEWFIEARRFVA